MEITLSLPMLLFLMLMTGFAGFVDSAAGGGGLISLPAYLFAGLPVHYTYGTNKFSAACGTTFATAQFFQKGAMNIRVGLLAAVGSFVGSALGSHIVLLLSDQVLRTMMLIILPVAAVLILWRRDLPDENRDDGTLNAKKAVLALAIGLGIGLYDGIFGPGTGTFAIIAFTTLMGFDLKTDKRSVLRIVAGIEGLTLKPPAGDIKVMQGLKDGTMRLRVGSWRVLYRYGEENALEILLVLDIGNRGDIYK